MSSQWYIHLFGGIRLRNEHETITRFRSQKFGALLAYLALFPQRQHSREELAELFWSDTDGEAARMNLRTALASLRRQLEPPGTEAGCVLMTQGRTYVSLNPEAFTTDVAEFETALGLATRVGAPEDEIRHLTRAVNMYDGPLLPGIYESWALNERERFAGAYHRSLRRLAILQEKAGDADAALDFARRAVSADPTGEESHALMIRLLVASGQTVAAKRQYDEMTRLLREQLDVVPSAETQALLESEDVPAPTPKILSLPIRGITTAPIQTGTITEVSRTSVATLPAPPPQPATVHLPLNRSRFFGREDEIAAIGERLQMPSTRLVTMTGPGGSGKTRVAIEAARALTDKFPGGIWFVPLADIREAARVPDAIADALGLHRRAPEPDALLDQITQALNPPKTPDDPGIPVLILLDNFEQIADEGATILADLLQRARHLRLLVTSRQRLRIEAEREFPLMPLPVPEYPGTPDRLLEFPSVQLFVSRAQQARTDFQMNTKNAASVAALCWKLEGIPLAIELAAAWSSILTPAQILERMEKRLDMLTSRRRDIAPRHRTLRATMESSVALLGDDVQRFFAQLSVFRGSWTLEAAETICDEWNALDCLTLLLDHSLILNAPTGDSGVVRFRMLETLREFAEERLSSEDGMTATMEARHTDYFVQMAAPGDITRGGPPNAEWLAAIEREHDNLRAALDRLLQGDDLETAFAFAHSLSLFWQARGFLTEGRQRFNALLVRFGDAVPPLLRARTLSTIGKFAYLQADYAPARAAHEACLEIYRAGNHQEGIARSLCELGNTEMLHANYAATTAFYLEGLEGYRALDDAKGLGITLSNLGAVSLAKGMPDTARPYLEESLIHSRKAGNERMVAVTLICLASICETEKDFARARSFYEQSLAIREKFGDISSIGKVQEGLGRVALAEKNADEALRYFDASLQSQRRGEQKENIASLLYYRALTLLQLKGDVPGAAENLRESLQQSRDIGHRHFAWLALGGMAAVAAAEQRLERTAQLWGAADALQKEIGVAAKPEEAARLASDIAEARATMGDAAFDINWTAGHLLSFMEAIALALEEETPAAD